MPSGDQSLRSTYDSAPLRRAISRCLAVGVDPRQLTYLALGLIYIQAKEGRWQEIAPDALGTELAQIAPRGTRFPEITEHNFTPLHDLGIAVRKIVEALGAHDAFMQVLAVSSAATFNEPFTPAEVARVMVSALAPPPGSKIYDPACRAGEILTAAPALVPDIAQMTFEASPLSSTARSLTAMNLAMHSISARLRNVSSSPWSSEPFNRANATIVLANPPFNMANWVDRPNRNWRYGQPPPHNANYAWLQYAVESLDIDGRAAVLMPENAPSSFREHAIRANMIEDGCIEAVVALPRQLFRKTRVAASLWLLRSGSKPCEGVLLIDASNFGRMAERTLRVLTEAEAKELISTVHGWRAGQSPENSFATAASLSDIRKRKFDLNPAGFLRQPTAYDPGNAKRSLNDAIHLRDSARRRADAAERVFDETLRSIQHLTKSAPGGWKRAKLGDICLITPGATLEETSSGEVLVVKPKDLASGRLRQPTAMTSRNTAERQAKYVLLDGDVLCTRTGTIGRTALVTRENQGWLYGTGLMRLRPEASDLNPLFLNLYLTHPEIQAWMSRNATGAAIKSINTKVLKSLDIRLPPIDDQIAVGQAFADFDNLIAAYDDLRVATSTLRNRAIPVFFSD
ncbi:N-6 DNA methylase [Nocardia sp. NPDC003482]